MSEAWTLFLVEVRRCLARRAVWVLVGIALAGTALASVLTFVNTSDADDGRSTREQVVQACIGGQRDSQAVARCRQMMPPDAFDNRVRLTDLWPEDRDDDPILAVTVIFLAIGALLGGASMVGADWRAGTMATLLTWEPRRVRLAVTRFAAVAVLAFLIAFALQVVFILGLLPSFLLHGTTDGADGGWLGGLLGAMLRGESLAAMAAVFGAAIAMIGRNTAAALGASFAYMMIGENIVRGWKPWLRPWLIAENSYIFLAGYTPVDVEIGRRFGEAALTLVLYAVGLAVVAVATFRARDIAST